MFSIWYDSNSVDQNGIESALAPHFDEIVSIQTSPPIVTVKTEGISAVDIAEHPAVSLISVAKGEPKNLVSPSPSETSAGYHATNSTYNDDGFYADGIEVGIVEQASSTNCALFENHEAFDKASISYTSPSSLKSCTDDFDCDFCNWGCINGTCTTRHPSRVASRISSSTNENLLHAAKADIVVGNGAE